MGYLEQLERRRAVLIEGGTPPAGYTGAIKFTIAAALIDGDLPDFPVIFNEQFNALFTADNGILDADGTNPMRSDGGDLIMATDILGVNRVPIDVRRVSTDNDPTLGEIVIAAKIPFISQITNTDFYLLWGGSETAQPAPDSTYGGRNAYDDDFVYVLDGTLNERKQGITLNNKSAYGSDDGLVGRALNFNSSIKAACSIDNSTILNDLASGAKLTISAILVNNNSTYARAVARQVSGVGTGTSQYQLGHHNTEGLRWSVKPEIDDFSSGTDEPAYPNWYMHTGKYDKSRPRWKHLLNKTEIAGGYPTNDIWVSDKPLIIGGCGETLASVDWTWNGKIGEVRISKIFRDTVWTEAEYDNMFQTPGWLTITQIN